MKLSKDYTDFKSKLDQIHAPMVRLYRWTLPCAGHDGSSHEKTRLDVQPGFELGRVRSA
jgi:hypothetical protein